MTATPRPVNDGPPRIAAAVRPSPDSLLPKPPDTLPVSTLSPELRRQVEMIAQREEELLQRGGPPTGPPPGTQSTANASAPSTRLEISRAPSPTEARPIRAIPVPEEFVPLPARSWSPNRKYFAAAATCHMPLYFQDASLERYGHNTEQFFGPLGRFMTYPVDDPTQSNQRNQILQPFFSIGLFAAQIALLPYNLIMDPPGSRNMTWVTTGRETSSPPICTTCLTRRRSPVARQELLTRPGGLERSDLQGAAGMAKVIGIGGVFFRKTERYIPGMRSTWDWSGPRRRRLFPWRRADDRKSRG